MKRSEKTPTAKIKAFQVTDTYIYVLFKNGELWRKGARWEKINLPK